MNDKRKKTTGNKKWIAITLLLLSTIPLAIWLRSGKKPVEITTEKAFRKNVTHIVTATGKIDPELVIAISPDVSGEIIELPVTDGQNISQGTLLFKIQPDLYINQVQQSQAQLDAAKSQSLEARSKKLKADDDFRKASLLYKEQLISESDYIVARTAAEAARAIYQASLHAIEQNRSLLVQNQDRLKKTIVTAPTDGTIIALNSKQGERVVGTGQFAGTEVLRLANLDSMQVEVEVNENDIINVSVGNPVTVTVDAWGDRHFKGVVREISNSAVVKEANSQEEVTNFAVKIRILNHDRTLKPGMSATAEIESIHVPNALVVPIQSVAIRSFTNTSAPDTSARDNNTTRALPRNNDARPGVFVVTKGTAWFRQVTTGTTDNSHIVITSGLRAGEEVVTGSYTAITTTLENGSHVRTQQKR